MSARVTGVAGGRLFAGGLVTPAQAVLEYSADDPYAVRARFRAGTPGRAAGAGLGYAFARDLLSAGLDVVSGQGDVRVRPGRGRTVIFELFTPAGTSRFATSATGIRRFLEETRLLVPPGTEAAHAGIDAGIAWLLAGGAL